MTPHQRLGVDAHADERQIKRAYALALRDNRPDQDAQAFQQLHEAYQAALALCRQADYERWLAQQESEQENEGEREAAQAGDGDARAPSATDGGETAAPARADVDVDVDAKVDAGNDPQSTTGNGNGNSNGDDDDDAPIELTIDQIGNAVIAGAFQLSADDYEVWLRGFAPLYSLYVKSVIAPQLPRALAQAPRLDSRRLEAIVRFFDLDTLGALDAQDQWLLEGLRRRARVDFDAFLAELRACCASRNTKTLRDWLMQRPEAREPDLCAYVAPMLHRTLMADLDEAPILPECMQLICECLGFAPSHALRRRNEVRWTLARADARTFGSASSSTVHELKRPFSPLRALTVAALLPPLSSALAELGGQLRHAYGSLPPPIDPRQYRFHAQLAYRGYWGRWRWAVYALRTALLFLLLWWLIDPRVAANVSLSLLAAQLGLLAFDSLTGRGPPPPRAPDPAKADAGATETPQ